MEIQNFQQTAGSVVHAASTLTGGPGVLQLKLTGEVGSGKSISFDVVARTIALQDFRHIHIEITTTGGCASEGLRIYDLLRAQPSPVSVRAVGICYSAGMVIFMSGAYRTASADAEFLAHPAGFSRDDLPKRLTAATLKERAVILAQTDGQLADLFSARTGYRRDWFVNEIETEETLSITDAIEVGLVHEVDGLTPKVDGAWPDQARIIAADRNIYLPRHLLTENYFAACRAAASLYRRPYDKS